MGSEGMLPQEIFKKEHSETFFPVFLDTKYQFPRQGWSSLEFSPKVKYLMEMDKWYRMGERVATTEFSVVYHCEFFFINFQKKT